MERMRGRGGVYVEGVFSYFGVANLMEYTKEVDIANDVNENSIGDNGNNKPLDEANDNGDNEYASAARCTEIIILTATPAESMILSALAESIMLSMPPAESMILSAPPAERIARSRPESQCASKPLRCEHQTLSGQKHHTLSATR